MNAEQDEEKRQLERLRQGELSALEWVYRKHGSRILNQCYRILLSRQAAEDAVHDILVRLPAAINTFRGESRFSTWLHRLAHNECLTRWEQGRNRKGLEERNREALSPRSDHREDGLEDKDLLHLALEALDPESRSLLWMKEAEGFALQEICEATGMNEGTLKSKLHRARHKAREVLLREMKNG